MPDPSNRTPTVIDVYCTARGCDFYRHGSRKASTFDSARMAGRRHAQRTGHMVRAELRYTLTWGGEGDAQDS